MSNQIVISSGAKVRNLSGVLTGTSGVVNSLGINVPDGIPQLDGSGKILVSQLPNSVMEYKGTWNASTNTPTLANGTGNAGDVYLCNVAGTVNFGAGPITFAVGDQVLYSGTTWERASGATGTVTSVAVTESGDALTITGSPITTSGTINIGFAGTTGQYVNGAGGLTTFPSLTGYVPYTGATTNVALGEFGLSGGYIGLDTTPTSTPTSVGTLSWDTAYLTPKVITGTGNTSLQIGQEEVILIHNNTGSTLTDGQVVYVTGSTGELPSVSLADASSETTSAATLGVITETIANGANGFATVSGIVHGLNTLAFNEGDLLWLSETAGQFTNVKPVSPAHLVLIGYVIKKAGGNGSILVKIQNTQELEECSDVLFTSLANNDILAYESSTDLWKNKTIANVLGYTPANDSLVVHLAGTETITGAKTFSQDILVNSVKVGKGAGTGTNNIAIGDNVLTDNTTGYANLAIGSYALWHNTLGFGNIALGREALIAATTGSLNIAIGDNTMKGVVTGGQNIAIGANTAQNATSGSSNTLIGYSVGNALTTGSNNIFIGLSAGSTVSTGNYNTIIGGFPSFSGSGSMSNNIILADGEGNIRYRWDGTQTLINGVALGSNAFTSTSYLPLSGGTLTGALSGTSATFSGAFTLSSLTTGYITKVGTSGLITFSKLYENSFGGIQINNTDTNGAQYYTTRLGPRGNNDGVSSTWYIPSNAAPTIGWGTSATSTAFSISTLADDVTRLYISSGGNVGIGVVPSDWNTLTPLQIKNVAFAGYTSGTTHVLYAASNFYYGGSGGGDKYIANGAASLYTQAAGEHVWYSAPNNTSGAGASLSFSEKMRISSGGLVGIGTSSPLTALNSTLTVLGTGIFQTTAGAGSYNENLRLNRNPGNAYASIALGGAYNSTSGTGVGQWTFVGTPSPLSYRLDFDYNGATKSYIDASSGVYVVLSDKDKKKDFEASNIGLKEVLQLKTTLYRMKDDDESVEKQLGFIAQEVKDLIPQAYVETIDGFIGLQDRPLIAALVKAIQELSQELNELKAKIK